METFTWFSFLELSVSVILISERFFEGILLDKQKHPSDG